MKLAILMLLSFLLLESAVARSSKVYWFTEENSVRIYPNTKMIGGISEVEFNEVIDDLETLYSPIVSRMGGTLKVNRLWKDPTANASAVRKDKIWEVNMYGGLARHPSITKDGFYIVLCHEIGHHLGGAPKIVEDEDVWASNEGQSDYYSTLKCLRSAFNNDDNSKIVASLGAPQFLQDSCKAAHPKKEDQMLCIRSGMAGASVAGFFATMRKQALPKFDTPDMKQVLKTNDSHPDTQCRLDTYLQGALCEKAFTEDVSQKDEVKGACHETTGQKIGLRPKCWFKSRK